MVQDNFDKSQIRKQLIINPNTKNSVLYELSNAITDNQKTIIRKFKAKIKKGTVPPNKKPLKLTEEYIEQLIINGLEANPGNIQLIGKATEFFIKVKDKASGMEEEIDMEAFRRIGLSAPTGD